MKKVIAFTLCILLCFGLAPVALADDGGGGHGHGPYEDIFTEFNDGNGNYILTTDAAIVSDERIDLHGGTLIINQDVTLSIEAGAKLELIGMKVTNSGLIVVEGATEEPQEGQPSNEGQLEIRSDIPPNGDNGQSIVYGIFVNEGTLEIKGRAEIRESGTLENKGILKIEGDIQVRNNSLLENSGNLILDGHLSFNGQDGTAILENKEQASVEINGELRLENGAELENNNCEITGGEHGRIELQNASVSGINFYENASSDPITNFDSHMQFRYEGTKWVKDAGGHGPGPGHDDAGAFEAFRVGESENFVISSTSAITVTITDENSVSLSQGTVTIAENVTVEIQAGGRLELRGMVITNSGIIRVEKDGSSDPPNGEFRIGDSAGSLVNNGEIKINGQAEIFDGAKLINSGNIEVDGEMRFDQEGELNNNNDIIVKDNGRLRFENGAKLTNNNGASITGEGNGTIEIQNRENDPVVDINGLDFYHKASDDNPIVSFGNHMEFKYYLVDGGLGKWAQGPADDSGGDDPNDQPGDPVEVTIKVEGNGSVSFGEIVITENNSNNINATNQDIIIITPDDGYGVKELLVGYDNEPTEIRSWDIRQTDDGNLAYMLEGFEEGFTIKVVFEEKNSQDLFKQYFVVLKSEAVGEQGQTNVSEIKRSLANQFASLGYMVKADGLSVSNIDVEDFEEKSYGTFVFNAGNSGDQIGYILENNSDIIFKHTDNSNVVEIKAINALEGHEDGHSEVIQIPGWESGTLEIFGYGNMMAMPLSTVAMTGDIGNEKIKLPFDVAQFHFGSFYSGYNNFGQYVMQENALCVKVASPTGEDIQRTLTWDLNRYTALKDEENIVYVFFGNDTFTISLPSGGIGYIQNLEITDNNEPGYKITEDNGVYTIKFLSNYYDDADLKLIITKNDNSTIEKNLNIRRVGLHLEKYTYPGHGPTDAQVFHGTQYSSKIDYSDGNHYRVYGTFYIPDGDEVAPKLFVTRTWDNGRVETEIINVLDDPAHNKNAEIYKEGVFIYNNSAPACDYLLYAGSESEAPDEINVLVMTGEIVGQDGQFGGITFGSGRGVAWKKSIR